MAICLRNSIDQRLASRHRLSDPFQRPAIRYPEQVRDNIRHEFSITAPDDLRLTASTVECHAHLVFTSSHETHGTKGASPAMKRSKRNRDLHRWTDRTQLSLTMEQAETDFNESTVVPGSNAVRSDPAAELTGH